MMASEQDGKGLQPPRPKHVLIIDDDEGVRSTAAAILESGGYEVSQASHGVDAQRIIAVNPADLILTDILMPLGDGLEVIRELRLAGNRTPIIVMSGSASVEGVIGRAAVQFGANLFLKKPFRPEQLIAAVKSLI